MPLNVFYVDDEMELCQNFMDLFASDDVAISTFVDPQQAIDAARRCQPDLILVDYRFPHTTGDLLASAMDPGIPKFLVTGDISVVTNYKFERIIPKPLKTPEIRSLLALYMPNRKIG